MSIKNSLRSFGDVKSIKNNIITASEASNITLQLTRIGKMLDESVLKFTKRYLIIQTELEEMKREFVGNVAIISEYLNLTKKEIRYDKFDNIVIGKHSNSINIPKLPNYEQKMLRQEKKINKYDYNITDYSINYKKKTINNNNHLRTTGNSRNRKSKIIINKISSPIEKKKKENNENFSERNITKSIDFNEYNLNSKLIAKPTHKKSQNSIKSSKQSINEYKRKNKQNDNKEKEFEKKKILDSLSDNKIKALYISLNSDVVPYNEKLKILNLNKELSHLVSKNDIYNNALLNINNKINLLKQQPIEEDEKIIIDKLSSYPSKTAKTGLNYLNSQKEKELIDNDNELNKKLLEMIYICIGDKLNKNQNLKEAYEELFKKYNEDSIRMLFFNYIYPRCYDDSINGKLNKNDMKEIINIITQNKMLISDNLVTNNNKTFSYIAFSLDEICEFLTGIQDLDDDLKEKIRNEIELKSLIEEEEKIRNMIKH